MRNYAEDYADVNFKFPSKSLAGVPTAIVSGAFAVYKSNGTTQSTAGLTFTSGFDSVTGLNNIKIDLSADAFYATGEDYQVVATAGTVDSVSIIGEVVGDFGIENDYQHGVAQTADNDTKIDILDTNIDTLVARVIGTIESGSHNPASTAQLGALTDWLNGGRLDLLLDAIPITAMRGTDSAATEAKQDIIDTNVDTLLTRIVGTLATGTHNPATAAQIAVLSDWIDGGRLDLLLDAIPTTAMRGTDSAATEAKQDIIDTNIDTLITQIGTAGAGLTDLGGMSTAMKAEVLAEAVKLLITQMSESYAADGTAPTMTQALMLIQQALTEFAIAGTTNTVKRLDGSTTAAAMTLDDATNPTSTTRTS